MESLVSECPESPWQPKFGSEVVDFAPWWPHFVKWYAAGDDICGGKQHRKVGQEFLLQIKKVREAIAQEGTRGFVKWLKICEFQGHQLQMGQHLGHWLPC